MSPSRPLAGRGNACAFSSTRRIILHASSFVKCLPRRKRESPITCPNASHTPYTLLPLSAHIESRGGTRCPRTRNLPLPLTRRTGPAAAGSPVHPATGSWPSSQTYAPIVPGEEPCFSWHVFPATGNPELRAFGRGPRAADLTPLSALFGAGARCLSSPAAHCRSKSLRTHHLRARPPAVQPCTPTRERS